MAQRPRRMPNIQSIIGCIPMIAVSVGVFVICIIYSITLSFTNSKLFPKFDFVGLMQYERLWDTPRWIISVQNIWLYGVLVIGFNLIFGYLLAAFMDQRIKQEDTLLSIFLYPSRCRSSTSLVGSGCSTNLSIVINEELGLRLVRVRTAIERDRHLQSHHRRSLARCRRHHGDPSRRPPRCRC